VPGKKNMNNTGKEENTYKDTLNLPRTSFSMKANLPQREPEMLKKWEKNGIYGLITETRKSSSKTFILHDGPPYANGHIHMGHVLNKLLKDICVKYFTMKGCYAPYVPGWDCHGLPVEHQLFKELKIEKENIGQVEFRKKAYDYAMKFVKIQREEFKRLGVFGDWENPYLTLTKDYEASILDSLADLYEKGYIYKGLKPVNWCRKCETALAEAEVEYENKVSPSIYVKFESTKKISGKKTYFVIWTTTPWTLLANVAVALHPEFLYSFVSVGDEVWILASELAAPLFAKINMKDNAVIEKKNGKEIVNDIKNAKHPFIDRDSRLVLADYVTGDEGTGCVHTAPGHGQDDYMTGVKYGLPMIMPVDGKGRFNTDVPEFAGREVFAANDAIIEKMSENGTLVYQDKVTHSYPHCWRCKEPIIFRATEQWFMKIDHNDLREKILHSIKDDVEWIPGSGRERISSMVESRPDWCLSRQRYWGVPIPAFQCASCGDSFTSTEIMRDIAALTRSRGVDVWFEKPVEELLKGPAVCKKCGSDKIRKEENILDVWFDSGISHRAVLDARKELGFPADLYLEGSDQHRGWFQAAMITSMAIKGEAPYRKVLTHGFVVDGEGKKMSKSLGNVIHPEDVMKNYGADILRLWVAASDYEGDIKLSPEILARLADGYRKIRNTFRYLLSNLYDFDSLKDIVDHDSLSEIDKWVLSRLSCLAKEADEHYAAWEFHKVYRSVYDFCVCEVSSFYLDVLKDIVYILAPCSRERRAAQTVIFRILHTLARVMAPILSFTMEEVWEHVVLGDKPVSIHLCDWPDVEKEMAGWYDPTLDAKWEKILGMKDPVMKRLEEKREKGIIGSSLEAGLIFYSGKSEVRKFLKDNEDIFPLIFRVSRVTVSDDPSDGMEETPGCEFAIKVIKAEGTKCPRCWNVREKTGTDKKYPGLCDRCGQVMTERSRNA